MDKPKAIFEYDNYREYLKDTYAHLKMTQRNFSFRFFSRAGGFKSPSFLKQVMEGKSKLSVESIAKFSKALKHSQEEAAFFRNLVLLNQATSTEEREICALELIRSRAFRKIHPLKESQYNFYSHWYYQVVREMVALPDFQEDPHWIAQQFLFTITPAQAKQAILELQLLGMIKRDEKGRFVMSEAIVQNIDGLTSPSFARCHKDVLKNAIEAIDLVPRDERDIFAVTFAASHEIAEKTKELLKSFRKDLVELGAQGDSSERVFQLNFQFFPLLKNPQEKT
jgi:uncharacterized protein (TIGR02147 family)